MNINQHLESTYLKTSEQAGCTDIDTTRIVTSLIEEAIDNHFKLVMVRPKFVKLAKKMIHEAKSKVLVGTVIGFHTGINTVEQKLKEATIAIEHNADDLDFVINYPAFLNGDVALVKEEVLTCTNLVLKNQKTIKWIIEIAALTDAQIITITQLIRDIVLDNFDTKDIDNVYVKSSTGFYKTENNKPNGATVHGIEIMLKNASPLPVKAAGGVKTYDDALKMINLGVSRIGTSSAKAIIDKENINSDY
jgi:deoxyribose-phosphate aldolase